LSDANHSDLHAVSDADDIARLRRHVAVQGQELERQRAEIDSLREEVQGLLNFAGMINAERARSLSPFRPALGLDPQYAPRPLRVPCRYLAARPPRPAPRISIVTPSFNQGAFIEQTICSVLSQGYPNLEYVVRDGGSTDGTTEALERYRPRLTRVVSEPDGGQADAINKGFAQCSGEIMAYLNSDDLLLPGALAHVASFFARHPEVDAVYGHRVVIDAHSRDIGMWVLPAHRDWVVKLQDFIPQETLFWRRSAWELAGALFDTNLRCAIDWDFLLRLVNRQARLVRLPRFLGAFRSHPAQKTTAHAKTALAEAAHLRARQHGRELQTDEIEHALRPFVVRQKALHLRQLANNRLPIPRATVKLV
jgi:hypothetical protein